MKAVLVTGGRDYDRFLTVCRELDDASPDDTNLDLLIHGGASGADSLAARWAKTHNIPEARFPADWSRHGKAAGPLRNTQMVRLAYSLEVAGWDVLVLAFPGGRGTASCISIAEQHGLTVRRVD